MKRALAALYTPTSVNGMISSSILQSFVFGRRDSSASRAARFPTTEAAVPHGNVRGNGFDELRVRQEPFKCQPKVVVTSNSDGLSESDFVLYEQF